MPGAVEPHPDAAVDAAVDEAPAAEFAWRRTWVDDRPALYGVAGRGGMPVVFLHGWALGSRSYRRSIDRLVAQGCHVHAPALPGFGGTPDLPRREFSFSGYADWVDGFLDPVGIEEEGVLMGPPVGG